MATPNLPRISSTGHLAGKATVQSTWRSTPQGRRQSHERPRSRCSSNVDLAGLSGAAVEHTSRPVTPLTLLPLSEGPAALNQQQRADDTLAYIAQLGGFTPEQDAFYPSWAALAASEAEVGSPDCVASLTFAASPEPAKLAAADTPAATPAVAVVKEVPVESKPAAVAAAAAVQKVGAEEKAKPKRASVGLAQERAEAVADPAATTTVFRVVQDLTYVQELLDNLRHVQQMFKNAGAGSGPVPAAMAAARMLTRSLTRAATRIRNMAKDSAQVLLSPEAVYTLAEFGWAEVVTFDAECAKSLGALEMEVHNTVTGHSTSFHRAAPDQAWVQVGFSTSTSADMQRVLAAVSQTSGVPQGDVSAPAAATTAGSSSGAASQEAGRKLLSLFDLAEQLSAASASVQSAAAAMQQWVDAQKAAAAEAMPTGNQVLVAAGAV